MTNDMYREAVKALKKASDDVVQAENERQPYYQKFWENDNLVKKYTDETAKEYFRIYNRSDDKTKKVIRKGFENAKLDEDQEFNRKEVARIIDRDFFIEVTPRRLLDPIDIWSSKDNSEDARNYSKAKQKCDYAREKLKRSSTLCANYILGLFGPDKIGSFSEVDPNVVELVDALASDAESLSYERSKI